MAETRRRRASKALTASAVLHAVCLVIVLRLLPDRPLPPRGVGPPIAAIEFSFSEASPRERANAARPEEPPPLPHRVGVGTVDRPPPRTQEAEPAEAEAPRVARPIDLSFEGLGDGAKQRAAAPPDSGAIDPLLLPPPESLGRRRSPAELHAEAERQTDAVENVRAGRAHPLLYDYLRNARELLTPEATRIADSLPLGPALAAKGWWRGYLGRLAEVNRGHTIDPPRGPEEEVGGRRPDVLGAYNEMERQAKSGAEERTAEVCLGVAPSQAVVVTLKRSSGNAALDRLAIDSFHSASLARPVVADIRPGLACYLVRISTYRMPPLPSLSFGWKNSHPDVIYPLKRISHVTVELESVDYGARRGPASLLHAP
jgi:hypothetical protein